MTDIARDLEKLKGEIEKAKTDVARMEGQRDELLSSLRGKHNCKTIEAARTLADNKRKKKEKLDAEVEEGYRELKEQYEW